MPSTAIGKPDKLSPAFNPIWWYTTSNTFGSEGFKYIFDIFPAGNTTNRLARLKTWPRPGDGYGAFGINQILKDNVSIHLIPSAHTITTCPQVYYNYDIWVGEEYVQSWPFLINYSIGGDLTLSGNAQVHGFQAGDEVDLDYANPNLYETVGITVLSVPSNKAITVDASFASYGISAGTATFTNRRKTIFSGQSLYSAYTAYNAALPLSELLTYTSSTYNVSITTATTKGQLLTNIPDGYNVRPENNMWINFYSSTLLNGYYVELTTNTGTFYYPGTVTTGTFATMAVGPDDFLHSPLSGVVYDVNHNNVSATTKFDCNTTQYSVKLILDATTSFVTTGGTVWGAPVFSAVSETKTFRYNSADTGKFTNIELYFMDRKSSVIPCNFELLSSKSGSFTNTEFTTIYGDYIAGKGGWGFNSYDSSTNIVNTVITEQLQVTTNFMTVSESNYFAELMTSKRAYIKIDGLLWPVIIRTTNIELPTKANRKNINKVLLVEYANKNTVQN